MEESKTITRLESKNRPENDHQVEETEEIEAVMMCWENSEGSLTDDQRERQNRSKLIYAW